MTVEVGSKPSRQAAQDGGEYLYSPPSITAPTTLGVQPLGITLQAHYAVSWFDPVNAMVSQTRSLLQWQFDGSCVLGFAGGSYYWWQNLTGWSIYGHGENAFWSPGQGCQRVQSQITATYFNGAFCAGQDTWNYLQGIIIAGGSSGQIWGWHDNTWVSEPWWCPPLHWTDDTGYGY